MPEIAFLHPGFLAAGAAVAALPILIHLLLRQRARTVEIGSVRFLRSVIRQHTRRRRIRQWLLLALRVLALLLLAALFARPFLDRAYLLGLNSEVIMLVDCSASMRTGARRDGEALFDQAWKQMHHELTRVPGQRSIRPTRMPYSAERNWTSPPWNRAPKSHGLQWRCRCSTIRSNCSTHDQRQRICDYWQNCPAVGFWSSHRASPICCGICKLPKEMCSYTKRPSGIVPICGSCWLGSWSSSGLFAAEPGSGKHSVRHMLT